MAGVPRDEATALATLDPSTTLAALSDSRRRPWKRGVHQGRAVVFLRPQRRIRLPICLGPGHFAPVVVGGIIGDNVPPGEYEVLLIQRQPDGRLSGSATVMIRVSKDRG